MDENLLTAMKNMSDLLTMGEILFGNEKEKSDMNEEKEKSFVKELESLINRYSKENGSDTPDFILADYLNKCLLIYDEIVNRREKWYGRGVVNPIDGSDKKTGQINLE